MDDRIAPAHGGAPAGAKAVWVRETRFGRWFLGTEIWRRYVLAEALRNLARMVEGRVPVGGHILDLGCGQGIAAPLLDAAFAPRRITGIDIDPELIALGQRQTYDAGLSDRLLLRPGNATDIPLADASVDLVLCHQVLHHLVPQREALAELHRVLRPSGLLLMAESCRSFIETGLVRALFRHPRESQRNADEYLDLVRSAGFRVDDRDVATSSPWWSRRDLGLLGSPDRRRLTQAEEPTEVLCVAVKM
ncbi:class I SAM-dependent methyltransferase [Thiocapsa rosea]|uniref:Methyltransferase family protein n=1 Tax=Thiocapsa rosea TaxID=69360 RepID=A0A495V534_9GAMM|nr:class I SAM-dependent methyltransferase [Thiocapsa rosea]RKT43437.1 methyltransferase family protein [Thiocapsa rosea]